MLFGSYRINERRDAAPRLSLRFARGELNFYACSLKYIEGDLDAVYDWSGDVMSPQWNPRAARKKLAAHPDMWALDTPGGRSVATPFVGGGCNRPGAPRISWSVTPHHEHPGAP